MTLNAAGAAELVLQGVEEGASTVSFVIVAPPGEAGRRFLLVAHPDHGETVHGSLGTDRGDSEALVTARRALADPRHRDGLVALPGSDAHGDVAWEAYLEVRRPIPELVIVGAGHIALPMTRIGADLGFRVWVVDDRPDFATTQRFPDAYRVLRADFADPFREVPLHRRTHVLLVTRGHRYDYDCLLKILAHDPPPAYIGMIGSRRRVRATFLQLVEEGIPRERLGEIHAPVGLDIGAETPEEIAVAVAAELVKVRRGGTGSSLRDVECVAEQLRGDASTGGDAP